MFNAVLLFKLTCTTVIQYFRIFDGYLYIIIFFQFREHAGKGESSKQYNPSFHLRYSYEGRIFFWAFPLYDPKNSSLIRRVTGFIPSEV